MLCPKCADELIDIGGELHCVRGNMGLSRRLSRQLSECYEIRSRRPREKPASFKIGGRWFCPACGTAVAEEEQGILRCSDCGRWLNVFVHELVEISTHDKVS